MPTPHIVRQGQPWIPPIQVAAANGAITLPYGGIVKITKGTAAALTLADPPVTAEGSILYIMSTTAAAHTVDNSAGSGFNAGGASSDVGTFGAAIGNSLILVALGGNWYVLNNIGVTLA